MYVSTCRHTMTDERLLGFGYECSLCLGPLLPLQSSKVCSCCGCRLHVACYRTVMEKITAMTAALEEQHESTEGEGESGNTKKEAAAPVAVVMDAPTPNPLSPPSGSAATRANEVEVLQAEPLAAASPSAPPDGPPSSSSLWPTPAQLSDFAAFLEEQRAGLWRRCLESFPAAAGTPTSESTDAAAPTRGASTTSFSLFSSPVASAAPDLPTSGGAADPTTSAASSAPPPAATPVGAREFFQQLFGGSAAFSYFSSASAADSTDGAAAARSAPSTKSPTGMLSRFLIDSGKSAVKSYLYAAQEEGKGDPNVDRIVASLLALVDHLLSRHPRLSRGLCQPLELQRVSKRQEALYAVACAALPDAPFLLPAADRPPAAAAAPRHETVALRGDPSLRLLRDVLRYAIAVYGEEYRRGTLSSMLSSALLFTFNRKLAAQASPEADDAAVTDILSLPPSALRLSRWSRRPTEPSYALLVDTLSQRIVVAFRGTLTEVDVLTDVCAFGVPFCGGHAHQGVAHAVNYLFDCRASARARAAAAACDKCEATDPATTAAAEAAVRAERAAQARQAAEGEEVLPRPPQLSYPDCAPDALLDTLEKLARAMPEYDIVVTGHSLGGGTAVLFGVRLFHDRALPPEVLDRVTVIAYAPLPTLSYPAVTAVDQRPFWSVVSGYDAVPRLQLNSIDRACALVSGGGGGAEGAEGAEEGEDDGVEMQSMAPSPQTSDAVSTVIRAAPEGEGEADEGGAARSAEDEDAALTHQYVMEDPPGDAAAAAGPSDDSSGENNNKNESGISSDKRREDGRPAGVSLPTHELHHPGRVLLLTTPWAPETNRLVEVPRGHVVTHDLFLVKPMIEHHMMDAYAEALKTVHTRAEIEALESAAAAREDGAGVGADTSAGAASSS